MSRPAAALLAVVVLVTLGCAKRDRSDTTNHQQQPAVGGICETPGQVAGHGGTVYRCRQLPDGRRVWRKQ